jgi:hypothetical protein
MAKIAQRLVAAGASPERARAFEQQFTQRVQTAQPGLGKPKDIEDAFDAEIAAFAAAKFPNTFRPPTIDDPRIDAYINFIYGPNKTQQLENKAFVTKAPNYNRVLNSLPQDPNKYNLDQYVVAKIANGVPYAQILQDVLNAPTDLLMGVTEGKMADIVSKYSGEYNDAINAIPTVKQELLDTNKYYKFGLPDPKLQYGLKENLSQGIVDFRTHPSVPRVLAEAGKEPGKAAAAAIGFKPGTRAADRLERESMQAGFGGFNQSINVLSALKKTQATPFVDEVKRREKLKKSTTLGG